MTTLNHSIIVTSTTFSGNALLREELNALNIPTTYNIDQKKLEGSELIDFLRKARADVVLVGREPFTAETFAACPWIRFMSLFGVGFDNLDLETMKKRNIGFGWTPGVNKRSVAEHVIGLAIGHFRNIIRCTHEMKQGLWKKDGGRELSSLKVGIVGLGNTGSETALLLKAFGCTVSFRDILDKSDVARALGITPLSYEDLLRSSDIVSFHVPSTSLTKGMFGAKELTLVQPHTMIINTSRGDVVDFEPVCKAASDGRLGGFATDVFVDEPFDTSSWGHVKNLYFTPHTAGTSREAQLALGRAAIRHIVEYLRNVI